MARKGTKKGGTSGRRSEPILTLADVRRIDLNAQEAGHPVARLMQRAGGALAAAVMSEIRALPKRPGPGIPIATFLCGKGNNGGDGATAARILLTKGVRVHVVLCDGAIRGPGAPALAGLPEEAVTGQRSARSTRPPTAKARPSWAEAPILVDCILGAGIQGTPRGAPARWIEWLNAQRRRRSGAKAKHRIIACDVPSGFRTSVCVQADRTVTFHAKKEGMEQTADPLTRQAAGAVEVASIGLPAGFERRIGFGDFLAGYRVPGSDSHKGDNGVVLVVAGSVPLAGAPYYVASGALRSGADLVHIVTAGAAADTIRAWGPGPIVHGAGGPDAQALDNAALDAVLDLLPRCGALVLGPGLGTRAKTRKFATHVLEAAAQRGVPLVVDADGLDAIAHLSTEARAQLVGRVVVTPHSREFADLSGQAATTRNVEAWAAANGFVVLRKGEVDVVSDGTRTRTCSGGHATLTVGGTGDVLAGIVGELLAKGASPFHAACAAAYMLKQAGALAGSLRSYGAPAEDVADAIPAILLRLES